MRWPRLAINVVLGPLVGGAAIVTGVATVQLGRLAGRGTRLAAAAPAGGAASMLLVGWLAFTGMTPGVGAWRGFILVGMGGAVAGLVCAALAELFERRPRTVGVHPGSP